VGWDRRVRAQRVDAFAVTSLAELSWEQFGGKLDSELRAAFLTTKAVVPGMVSRSYGRLIYQELDPAPAERQRSMPAAS
jgi:hypothetical protein